MEKNDFESLAKRDPSKYASFLRQDLTIQINNVIAKYLSKGNEKIIFFSYTKFIGKVRGIWGVVIIGKPGDAIENNELYSGGLLRKTVENSFIVLL